MCHLLGEENWNYVRQRIHISYWNIPLTVGGLGSMREPSEMHTASRMQNLVQIRAQNAYFVTKVFVRFVFVTFRALGVESPRGGAIPYSAKHSQYTINNFCKFTFKGRRVGRSSINLAPPWGTACWTQLNNQHSLLKTQSTINS